MVLLWLSLLMLAVWPDYPAYGQGEPAFFMGQGRTGEKRGSVWAIWSRDVLDNPFGNRKAGHANWLGK